MSDLRKDPVVGRWVIIAPERGKRPSDFSEEIKPRKKGGFCPFCPGNEDKTPPEIMAYREPGSMPNHPGWRVRVVPNKFPVLQIEGELSKAGEGIYDRMNGIGAHEVIIETPDHDVALSDLPVESIGEVINAMKSRIIDLKNDIRLKYMLVFKNWGEAAGASLEHSHSQLIATPVIPKRILEELGGSRQYYEYRDRCVFCDIIRQEKETGKRMASENDMFIAFLPFASRFPFEVWIMPKFHSHAFEEIEEDKIISLSWILKDVLSRLFLALMDPPYNLVIHSAPVGIQCSDYYHWHIEIMPKLTKIAGFEWGTGFYINPTPPEEAALYLKEIEVKI